MCAVVVSGCLLAWGPTRPLAHRALCCRLQPLLSGSGAVTFRMMGRSMVEGRARYNGAGGVASEVLSSIRTVAAFGGEDKELQRFRVKVLETEAFGVKTAVAMVRY
jgi:hypothetical protein